MDSIEHRKEEPLGMHTIRTPVTPVKSKLIFSISKSAGLVKLMSKNRVNIFRGWWWDDGYCIGHCWGSSILWSLLSSLVQDDIQGTNAFPVRLGT
jgi:hypothetical protein